MTRFAALAPLFLLTVLLSGDQPIEANSPRVTEFNIIFVNYCDGLDLRIRSRLGAAGTHTGCGFGERVSGDTFTTTEGEQGVTVSYYDQTVRRPQRIDVFVSGFRAGKFYVYDGFTGVLSRFGDWDYAPPAP